MPKLIVLIFKPLSYLPGRTVHPGGFYVFIGYRRIPSREFGLIASTKGTTAVLRLKLLASFTAVICRWLYIAMVTLLTAALEPGLDPVGLFLVER